MRRFQTVMGIDDSQLRAEVKAEAEKHAVVEEAKEEPILEIPPEFEVPSMMDGIEIDGMEGMGLSEGMGLDDGIGLDDGAGFNEEMDLA